MARRGVWTLLRDVRIDRSVLLTTHHMEESRGVGGPGGDHGGRERDVLRHSIFP